MTELREYEKIILPDCINGDDILHLHEFHEKNIKIGANKGKHYLKAKSKVGTIKLPSGEIIQIKPKVGVDCLMYMIAIAHNMPNTQFRYLVNHSSIKDDSPLDLYVRVLIFWVELLLKRGLLKSYKTTTASIGSIKGKMLTSHLNKTNDKRWCEFDELSYSDPANEVIKATLKHIQKQMINKSLNTSVKGLLQRMNSISDITLTTKSFRSIQYSSLNKHYESMLDLSDLIFHNLRLSEAKGSRFFSGFMIDMNKVFEKFLFNILKNKLSQETVKSTYNNTWANNLNKHTYLPRLIPDILILDRLVIDAKYYSTPLTKSDKFRSDNLYQLKAYMNVFEVNGVLIYPKNKTEIESTYEFNGKTFTVITLALDKTPEKMNMEIDKLVLKLKVLFKK